MRCARRRDGSAFLTYRELAAELAAHLLVGVAVEVEREHARLEVRERRVAVRAPVDEPLAAVGEPVLCGVDAGGIGVAARGLDIDGIRTVAGPALERKGDMAAILTALESRDVLFVDEIHRLNPAVEEILYPAMEDFRLDILIGEGPMARTMKVDLPPFTLVGATTRAGMLTNPLRDRFGIVARLEFYTPEELTTIVTRSARLLANAGAYRINRHHRFSVRLEIPIQGLHYQKLATFKRFILDGCHYGADDACELHCS